MIGNSTVCAFIYWLNVGCVYNYVWTQCITGWRRSIGYLISAGHFPKMSPFISGYFLERGLRDTACVTHCNTLQHTAAHCNTLPHTVMHCSMRCGKRPARHGVCITLHHSASHCVTLQHTATHCNSATQCAERNLHDMAFAGSWPPSITSPFHKSLVISGTRRCKSSQTVSNLVQSTS